MTKQIKWEHSLTALFLIFSAVILVLMLFQYIYGSNYRSQLLQQLGHTESAGFTMETIPDYKMKKKGIATYQDIVERPLFFKVRKPIELTEDDSMVINNVSEKFVFILTGIINTPQGLYCLLENPVAKEAVEKFRRLEQGDEIEGRTIREIQSDRIVIDYDGTTEEIMLNKPRPKIVPRKTKKPLVRSTKKRLPTAKPAKKTLSPF